MTREGIISKVEVEEELEVVVMDETGFEQQQLQLWKKKKLKQRTR